MYFINTVKLKAWTLGRDGKCKMMYPVVCIIGKL